MFTVSFDNVNIVAWFKKKKKQMHEFYDFTGLLLHDE